MAITRLGGATAITGTIPQGNIANASLGAVTALPGAIATGKVLQVQQQVITTFKQTNSTSFIDTGFSIAITPSSSSSKFLCVVSLQSVGKNSSTDSAMSVRIVRGSTDIGITTNVMYSAAGARYETLNLSKLDAPNTANETTYKVTYKNRESSNSVYFNAYAGDTSTFTIYEIES